MKSIILFLMLLFGLFGCAGIPLSKDECNATLFPTAHEHELCLKAASDYEQAEHEKEDKRIIRRDKIIAFLNACDQNNRLVVVEIRRGAGRACLPNERQQRDAKREYGYKYTHDNVCRRAHRSNFQCWPAQDFKDFIKNAGF